MADKIKQRNRVFILAVILMIFYLIFAFFVSEKILSMHTLNKFVISLIFFLLGIFIFSFAVFSKYVRKKIKPVFYRYLLTEGAVYLAFVEVFSLIGIFCVRNEIFLYIHTICFGIYTFVLLYTYIIGRR